VFAVNVPVGETMEAGDEIAREMGVELVEGVTVAVVVAVWPTMTYEIGEKVTVAGVTS